VVFLVGLTCEGVMSVIMIVELKPDMPNLKHGYAGDVLGRWQMDLDALAVRLGLAPLEAFYPSRGKAWFKPADGLRTVEGLIPYCREGSASLASLDLPESARADLAGLDEDLAALAKVLRAAQEAGSRFRFDCM
jgi:hypothetical protein